VRAAFITYPRYNMNRLTASELKSESYPVLAYATAVCCVAYGSSAVVHLGSSKHIIVSSTSAS
jgi:hypothetical protein